MHKFAKKSMILFVVVCVAVVSISVPSMAREKYEQEEIGAGRMVADFFFIRPFGVAATIFGSAVFIVALPFSAVAGNAEQTYEKLVLDPAKFTFERPLGSF